MADGMVTLQVSERTYEAIVNCVRACAEDEREPERYRQWYAAALAEVEAAKG